MAPRSGFEYGMPSYKRNGQPEVAFASQKNYIALYFMKKDVLTQNASLLKGLDTGKGCIRFRTPEQVDLGLVEKLLHESIKSKATPC